MYLTTHFMTYDGTFFRHSVLLFFDIGPLCLHKSALIGEKMHSP